MGAPEPLFGGSLIEGVGGSILYLVRKDGADRPRGIALLEKALAGTPGPVEAYIERAVAYGSHQNPGAAAENALV